MLHTFFYMIVASFQTDLLAGTEKLIHKNTLWPRVMFKIGNNFSVGRPRSFAAFGLKMRLVIDSVEEISILNFLCDQTQRNGTSYISLSHVIKHYRCTHDPIDVPQALSALCTMQSEGSRGKPGPDQGGKCEFLLCYGLLKIASFLIQITILDQW